MSDPHKIRPWFRKHDGWWYVTRQTESGRKQVKLARGKENEEQAYLKFYELMAASGHIEPSTELTFNELAARFLMYSKRENAAATVRSHVWILDDFDHFYDGRVIDLKKSHVERWLDEHPQWGQSSRRRGIITIKRAVNWGYEEGYLAEYPVGLRKLRRPKMGKRETLISEADHRRMIAASDESFGRVLTALWETGARPQEVRMVTAEMVHLELGIWLLREHKTSETTEKPRTIYLNETMVELSRTLTKRHPNGPIFRGPSNKPWTSGAIRGRMARLRQKLGLPDGTVAYAYRHTYATTGLQNGASIADMAELLGHADTRMLMEHYGHLSQKTQHMRGIASRVTRTDSPAKQEDFDPKAGRAEAAPSKNDRS